MSAGRSLLLGALAILASCAVPPDDVVRPSSVARTTQAADWSAGAVAPIRIRQRHTATLVGTGEVFVAGGGSAPRTTEIVDPHRAVVVPGPDLLEPRSDHTATMLLGGKVLLAGGETEGVGTASAELYDPITRTTTATSPMSVPRARHAAIRLRSGKVLISGGSTDLATELYDPLLGTWSVGPTRKGEPIVHAMAMLADGRVVATSGSPTITTEVLAADGSAWSIVIQGYPSAEVLTMTRLPDGRVAAGQVLGCNIIGSTPNCSSITSVLASDASTTVPGPDFLRGRDAFTAARTVEGEVLFVGGQIGSDPAERLTDATAARLTSDVGRLTAEHIAPTATVLPGGDILVVGGLQANLERRPSPGRWAPMGAGIFLLHSREKHAATRLHDGTVLVAGGETRIASHLGEDTPALEAERIDRVTNTISAAGTLPSAHLFGTLTTLRDGRAILVGGGTVDVAIYTPGSGWTAGAPLIHPRTAHTATLLPSGKLLVVGGTAAAAPSEIFDPATSSWSAGPTPEHRFLYCDNPDRGACSNHGAVLMPNGRVLVTGGAVAELYDERGARFEAATPPGASHAGTSARLLSNGKVFVAGGTTLAAEVYDPEAGTWSYTGPLDYPLIGEQFSSLPSGRVISSGGHLFGISGITPTQRQFDPIAHPTGTFSTIPTGAFAVFLHSATLAGTGEVVQAGGHPCWGACPSDSINGVAVYGDGAAPSLRPTISDAPATVTAGTRVVIVGSGFANGAEASDGSTQASAVNHPTAVWVSDAGDAVVPSTIVDFTETTATWLVPTTALYGHGQLFVNVGGVYSFGRSVTITPALAATTCANDAQCDTGFCTDGVCCDRRCDGVCEGCTAARKTSGDDGVCGAVPPGKDITGRCVLKLGEACSGGNECGTGFCAQGVCCDSTCDGQCLACNLEGRVGRCSGIEEGAGCAPRCDGQHSLLVLGRVVEDCGVYGCNEGASVCKDRCASADDCVAPAVCNYDGLCVAPVVPPASSHSVCGCRAVGAPAPVGSVAVALAGIVLFAARRRRK